MFLIVFLFALALSPGFSAEKVKFDGFRVYRIVPENREQLDTLKELQDDRNMNFWSSVGGNEDPVDVMVAPHIRPDFEQMLKHLNLSSSVLIEDVQRLIAIEEEKDSIRAGFGWTAYNNLNSINTWLRNLGKEFSEVSTVVSGKSYEGRNITGVKLSFNEANDIIFVEGGIHAREWITPACTTYFIKEILTNTDEEDKKLFRSYDWYFFPVTNPDGYVYTFNTNRMWRKNRRNSLGGWFCSGVDLNRNWDYKWMEGGASNWPCSERFAGSQPFSEPETLSLSRFLKPIGEKLVAYISFHSYSQLLLIPYGHTKQKLDNYEETYDIGSKVVEELAKKYGTQYKHGNIAETIYIATGSSTDYVKGNYRTPVVYTYELRDKGQYGFLLPSEQIIPTCSETYDSIRTMLKEMQQRKIKPISKQKMSQT